MGLQNNWHGDFFYFDNQKEYTVNHWQQYISKHEEENNPTFFETAKENYKQSEMLYSEALLDSDLLTRVINDPGSNAFSDQTKKLILESKLKTLKPLMVNASSATREAELQGYEEEFEQYTKKLQVINSRNKNPEDKTKALLDTNTNKEENKKKVESIFQAIIDFLKYLFILSPLALVRWIGERNLNRLSLTFSRISLKNLLTYLKSLGVLDKGSKLHGIFINIAMLDYPATVFSLLSVFIFMAKLLVNITLPFKHLFAPTSRAELAFGWWTRAKMEVMRVWDIYANDIFWMVFNGITNFPLVVGLSIPVANWILAGALFFDIAVLGRVLYLEDKKLANEIAWLNQQITLAKTNNNLPHQEMYTAMRSQAEISRVGIRATLIACIIATALFIASLALIFTLATPLMAPIGFFACVVAVAVILSRKEIGKYAEAKASQSVYQDQYETKALRAENASKTGWQLAKSLTEHIVIPMIIMGLYTVSLPAAIAFTVLYVAIKTSGVKLTDFECNNKPKALAFEEKVPEQTFSLG